MNPVTQHLISSYLLMPLLTVIFGIAAYFIARKNKLLNNRKLIVYLLLCGMILALPALCGFMDYSFMPYVYILLVVLYWTAGHYNRFILRKVFASGKEMPSFGIQCLLTVTVTLLGAGYELMPGFQIGVYGSCFLFIFLVIAGLYRKILPLVLLGYAMVYVIGVLIPLLGYVVSMMNYFASVG